MKRASSCAAIIFLLLLSMISVPCFAKGNVKEIIELFHEEQTVVTAAKYEQKTSEAPASVTVITADDIRRYGYRKLSDVLRGTTGMYVIYDRNYEYLGVRGYYIPGDFSSRTLILVNGVTMNDSVYGSGFIGYDLGIDMDQVKRIEIVKGPGSALYGTYALFAVINVITKDGTDVNGLKISGEYGDYQLEEGLMTYGAKSSHGLDVFASGYMLGSKGQNLFFPQFDAPETNNGVFENGDWEKSSGYLVKLTNGDLRFQGHWSSRLKGVPTGAYNTAFNDNRTKTNDSSNFLEVSYTPKLDSAKDLMVRVFHSQYSFMGDYYEWRQDPVIGMHEEDSVEPAVDNWVGMEAQLNWRTSGKNLLSLGGEFQDHYLVQQKAFDAGLAGPQFFHLYLNDIRSLEISSFYLQDIHRLTDDLSFILGGRYDDYSTFGVTINPRIGIIYAPPNIGTVKLLYGSAFRAPVFYELYYNDGGFTSLPNPNLKPEQLKTYELIFEKQIGRNLTGTVSLFHTNLSNIISQVDSSTLSPFTGLPLLQYQNIGSARASGVELTMKGHWKGIEAHLGYSYLATEDEETGIILPNSPGDLANFGVSVPLFNQKLFCTVEIEHVGKRLDATLDEWVDPYTKTNLVLFSDRLPMDMEASFKLENLFDVTYYDPVSTEFIQDKIKQDGRKFLLKIDHRF